MSCIGFNRSAVRGSLPIYPVPCRIRRTNEKMVIAIPQHTKVLVLPAFAADLGSGDFHC